MKSLARPDLAGSLGTTLIMGNLVVRALSRDAPFWMDLVAFVGIILILLQFRLSSALDRATRRTWLTRNSLPICWAMLAYSCVLIFAGNHLGWSPEQAGAVGLFVFAFTAFASAGWSWAREHEQPRSAHESP